MKKISILIIGSEILNGITIDTNSNFITKLLRQNGILVNKILTVSDNARDIQNAIDFLMIEHEYIITTGGLGPTKDDISKKVISQYFNLQLKFNEETYRILKNKFKKINLNKEHNNKIIFDKNNAYNFIPEGFIALENTVGIAPILSYREKINNKKILMLPGVPYEVKMSKEHILDFCHSEDDEKKDMTTSIFKIRELSEDKIFFKLCPNLWQDLEQFSQISCLPNLSGIKLILKYRKENHDTVQSLVKNSLLNPYIWQESETSLVQSIVNIAREKEQTFCFAESCTGGLVSSLITDISGSSKVFKGSIISYSNDAKVDLLNINSEKIEKLNAVSKAIALDMARGALDKFQTSFAISFTGMAGPNSEKDIPVGRVFIALAQQNLPPKSWKFEFTGSRKFLKNKFAVYGLFKLLDALRQV